jgi:hypothetical protein
MERATMGRATAGRLPAVVRKSVSLVRRDIRSWRQAVEFALRAENPKNVNLQDLYDDIMLDNLLTSQVNNRMEQTISCGVELVSDTGQVDEGQTSMLLETGILPTLFRYMLEADLYGYSLVELSSDGAVFDVSSVPRRNVVPALGRFYPDVATDDYILYREASEYGRWLLEFDSGGLGLLNRLSSVCLFKKFAASCWSELCEIYGIPPRYLKTETTDEAMLNRAEAMMRDIGSASWFIIDKSEEFEFAQGATTNGDVYANLIRLCSNEISLAVSGAIIGQDTENGNYSKEEQAQKVLGRLVNSDKRRVEEWMNRLVLPALRFLGTLSMSDLKFRFSAVEDNDRLWNITRDLLPYKEVDSDWITEKFGIPVRDRLPEDGTDGRLHARLSEMMNENPF